MSTTDKPTIKAEEAAPDDALGQTLGRCKLLDKSANAGSSQSMGPSRRSRSNAGSLSRSASCGWTPVCSGQGTGGALRGGRPRRWPHPIIPTSLPSMPEKCSPALAPLSKLRHQKRK